ncbi:endonuclease/exonuclease/phosphatase family protein, partial [Vibrio parahaemolyticus]|nr:endonuclease/exonuclease/phosphatase family protein [Vibrio parahaemolyticus]
KSALYSEYPLSNGSTLAVANIHAVNFTLGVQAYQQQIDVLVNALTKHQGPVILAGDFNSWNEARWSTLRDIVEKLALQEVVFQPDLRTRFITGRVLDHVFYRGLTLEKAKAPTTDASDHNPLLLGFKISAQTVPK